MTVVLIGRSAGSFAWTPGEWLSPRELLSNEPVLREANLWEAALVDSYRQSTGTNPGAGVELFRRLFGEADRARLRGAGDPFPSSAPFLLFRGCVGASPIRGLSWT